MVFGGEYVGCVEKECGVVDEVGVFVEVVLVYGFGGCFV